MLTVAPAIAARGRSGDPVIPTSGIKIASIPVAKAQIIAAAQRGYQFRIYFSDHTSNLGMGKI